LQSFNLDTALVSIDSLDWNKETLLEVSSVSWVSRFFYDYQSSTNISDVIDQLLCSICQALVENIKRQAYKNVNNFIQVDASAIFGPSRSLTPLQAEPFNGPNLALQQLEFPVTRQGI
jgi:hypothetical protein